MASVWWLLCACACASQLGAALGCVCDTATSNTQTSTSAAWTSALSTLKPSSSSSSSSRSSARSTSLLQPSCAPCSIVDGNQVNPGTKFLYAAPTCTNVSVPGSPPIWIQLIVNCSCPCSCGCNCTCDGANSQLCDNATSPAIPALITYGNTSSSCNASANTSVTVTTPTLPSTTAGQTTTQSASVSSSTTTTLATTTNSCKCTAFDGSLQVAPGSSGSSLSCSNNDALNPPIYLLFVVNFTCDCTCGCVCNLTTPKFAGSCSASTNNSYSITPGFCSTLSTASSLHRKKRQAQQSTSICTCPGNSSASSTAEPTTSTVNVNSLSSTASVLTLSSSSSSSNVSSLSVLSSTSLIYTASFGPTTVSNSYSEPPVATAGNNQITIIIVVIVVLGIALIVGIIVLIWYMRSLPRNYPLVEGHPEAKRQIANNQSFKKSKFSQPLVYTSHSHSLLLASIDVSVARTPL